ncbi:MAG: hypothetical protein ACI9T9_001838 [Oleiphilaceae bacterium]
MESAMSVDVPLNDIRIKEFPTINLAGGVDFDLDNIRIKELATITLSPLTLTPISVGITELPDININAKLDPVKLETNSKLETDSTVKTDSVLNTDSKVDLNLDVRISELPQIDLQLGLRPMRFHLPLSYKFCLKVFGIKVFEFKTCGEGMLIAEEYKAKSTEKCE